MKTVIEMAREAGLVGGPVYARGLDRFAELVRADEREQIAQMIEDAPPLIPFAQNDQGGCIMCGSAPTQASAAIRARSNT